MRSLISAFLIGSLFGGGLIVSGMTNPAKVQNFLDLFGRWDPSLAFVMGGALVVTFVGFRLTWQRPAPIDHDRFEVPQSTELTRSLAIGSVLFGIGWGLAGLCPGPALAVIPMAPAPAMIFFIGLYGGVVLHQLWDRRVKLNTGTASASEGAVPATLATGTKLSPARHLSGEQERDRDRP
jgi:uncharacterized membrane protein YedE/YeeE